MKALGGNRFPSLPAQVRNVVAATGRVARAVIANRPITVPDHVRQERETICSTCEENLAGRCRKCGCGVHSQFIRKTHLATEECPLTPPKWNTWP